ncbi:MAG: trypsin-like peptidase domain-containing protein, partial [Alphaproteobacteria bacterium]|nr:trypsin-like peptidase domain-containing protein [Alphaproteobacteria bacterium]
MARASTDRGGSSAKTIPDQSSKHRWIGLALCALLCAPVAMVSPAAWSGIDRAAAESAGIDFSAVVARVKPAVVGVRAIVTLPMDERPASLPLSPKGLGLPKEKKPGELPQHPHAATSQGSGFFVSADGYIVTTNHVIENSHHIEITTDDDKTYPARIAGRDPKTDLALLKVDTGNAFPFVGFAHHAPQAGEAVIAIGYPFGLGGTVTAGIVSARARDIKMGAYNDFLQIDAPVNRGNSGGPSF